MRSLSACLLPLILAAATLPAPALASGVSGGGIGGGSGPSAQRVVDERYEYGKAVFLGREPGTSKIPYCVLVNGEPKKLKRRTLKPYRGGSMVDFANALHRCDDASQLALNSIQQNQVPHVLYYLNKRYRLKLGNDG